MARNVRVWFDREGDYLEVLFSDAPGYMRPTEHDAVMECVDDQDNLLGFSIMNVSRIAADHPLLAHLPDTLAG